MTAEDEISCVILRLFLWAGEGRFFCEKLVDEVKAASTFLFSFFFLVGNVAWTKERERNASNKLPGNRVTFSSYTHKRKTLFLFFESGAEQNDLFTNSALDDLRIWKKKEQKKKWP